MAVPQKGGFSNLHNATHATKLNNAVTRVKALRTGTVQQLGTLADKAAGATGLSVQGYLSRALNVAKGYMSKEYAAADIATRVWHNVAGKEVDAAWKEALANPKVAESLAIVAKNKSATPIQLKRLYNYLISVGAVDAGGNLTTGDYPKQQ